MEFWPKKDRVMEFYKQILNFHDRRRYAATFQNPTDTYVD